MKVDKKGAQKVRFVGVGVVNTLIDFGVLFTLKSFGLPAVSANVVSTTTAFCFSFFANKKYTFQTNGTNVKREILLFITVTLFGLWVLQSGTIAILNPLFVQFGMSADGALLVAKLIATGVSLVWNYTLYSRVVFRQP